MLKIKKALIRLIYRYILPSFGLLFIKAISSTYKIKIINSVKETDSNIEKKSVIYAIWHQRFFPIIVFLAKKKPIAAIASQSNDGELISRVINALGFHTVRGSSSKEGKKALKDITFLAQAGYAVAHAVDGPQGPFGIVKPGVIRIAQLTQASIIPVIISCNNCWIFNSWDHFMVPRPFAKIVVNFAQPYKVSRKTSRKEFENKRIMLENKMIELHKNADLIWK